MFYFPLLKYPKRFTDFLQQTTAFWQKKLFHFKSYKTASGSLFFTLDINIYLGLYKY